MLVVTARPEIEDRHPSWLARARRSTVLSLSSLSDTSVREIVTVALPGATPQLLDSVLERAAGSPLDAEQLAAMFREQAGGARNQLDESRSPRTSMRS